MPGKKYFYLLAIIIFINAVYPQGKLSITGIITNNEKLPVHNANIKIQDTHIGTVSDINGRYEINNLAEGQYILIVSCIGYKKEAKPVSISQ